jgi:Ni/Co efflux regulator RcnB
MQKTLGTVLAAAIALTPLAGAAAAQRHDNHGPQQQSWKKWRKGERFDQHHARNYRQIDYRQYRGLRAPPRGYRWVRSDNDAVLVAISTGIIASVVANAVR